MYNERWRHRWICVDLTLYNSVFSQTENISKLLHIYTVNWTLQLKLEKIFMFRNEHVKDGLRDLLVMTEKLAVLVQAIQELCYDSQMDKKVFLGNCKVDL